MADSKDCLVVMLEEIRREGATFTIYDADRRERWFDALAQVIGSLSTADQRLAWVALVAHDLCLRVPGLPLCIAAQPLLDRLRGMGVLS